MKKRSTSPARRRAQAGRRPSTPPPKKTSAPAKAKAKAAARKGGPAAVVGLVSSAGGLVALQGFFDAMPGGSGLAFVVVPHLDPAHESLMAPLLGRHTAMPVGEASQGARLEADHVYVIPPSAGLTVEGGALRLGPLPTHGTAIDPFLRSLAEDQGERAIAVVLSGTGSHGAVGVRAIKEHGGVAFAQDPATAEQDGMPRAALATGLVERALAVEELPPLLAAYAQGLSPSRPEGPVSGELLTQLMNVVRARTRFDFRCYRQEMLLRRIHRRRALAHLEGLPEYLKLLRQDAAEAKRLARDLLIGVTRFFRDPAMYQVLEAAVLPQLLRDHPPDAPVRVWVPGCATGEEAYSIAMVVLERLGAAGLDGRVQVFATDLDADAIAFARRGLYPDGIAADVSPERLRRFFTREGESGWQVTRELRDAVLFSPQDLLADAPFSRVDLVSCRNLLIYLEPEVQQRLVQLFHFALNEGGCLVLGPSESLGRHADLFQPVSKKWRIFRRVGARRRLEFPVRTAGSGGGRPAVVPGPTRAPAVAELAQQALAADFAPAAVAVNRRNEVVFFTGPTELYLKQPTGAPTQDLLALARSGLRARLVALTQRALVQGARVSAIGGTLKRGARSVDVRVTARPLPVPGGEPLALLTFEDEPRPKKPRASRAEELGDRALVRQLERELKRTREELQSTVEEMEGSNEELKASNEEVTSANEELQSTNEELETSKEELQSLNEELSTVNIQLREKVDELEASTADMANLLTSVDLPTLFLGHDRRIRRFTPAATGLFNLIATDLGRPLGDLTARFEDPALMGDVDAVLRTQAPARAEVRSEEGRWYLRRVNPYRAADGRVEGVVLTFVDIDALKGAQARTEAVLGELEARVAQRTAELERERSLLGAVLDTAHVGIFVLDAQGRFTHANRALERLVGYELEALRGQALAELLLPDGADDEAAGQFRQLLAERGTHTGLATWRTKDGALKTISCSGTRLEDGKPEGVVCTAVDVTAEMKATAELRAERDLLDAILEAVPALVLIADRSGAIVRFNRACEAAAGRASEEMVGRLIYEVLLPPERMEAAKALFHAVVAGRFPQSGEVRWVRKDGTERTVAWTATGLLDGKGRVSHVLATGTDVTPQREAEAVAREHVEELAVLHRLQTAAELSTALAHELNQPLAAIASYAEATLRALKQEHPDQAQVVSNLRRIAEQALRAGMTVHDLRRFISRGTVERGPLDLNACVAAACELLEPITQGVRLVQELASGLSPVLANRQQVEQVLVNLVRNALEAMHGAGIESGTITLTTRDGRGMAEVSVADTGPGIPPESVPRLFESFFTTKPDGLGMGLPISRTLVEANGGRLWPEPNTPGAVFCFSLPYVSAEAEAAGPTS